MFGLIFRLIFSLGIIVWYSANIWNMIAEYFNKEFQRLLLNDTDVEKHVEL